MRRIKVLVVEDSIVFGKLLVQGLSEDPMLEVVALAKDPFEARDAILKYQPDVMTLDIELPKMDGIEFLKMLMPQHPLPVIVISTLSNRVFDALNAGAVDFVAKPVGVGVHQLEAFIKNELPVKIKIASVARVNGVKSNTIEFSKQPLVGKSKDVVIAIGASTGGPEAIAAVLSEFGTEIPGIVMVQHMPPGFTEMYAQRLDKRCKIRVKEAKTGDIVVPGQALLAPAGDSHMQLVNANGVMQVVVKKGERVSGHMPSVDVLFTSVAEVAKDRAVGIILTGMGGDGAKGLLAMKKAGARTIGQDESTCVVYGMPKVAYDSGAVEFQEKLSDVAKRTYAILSKM